MKKNINLWIVFCSIFIFSIKWYHPFSNFNENIDVRVIFESVSDSYYYYPSLKALSNFNLSYSFDPSIENFRTCKKFGMVNNATDNANDCILSKLNNLKIL